MKICRKAMDEHGSEWTRENRRVLDLSKKPLRNSVPRGFPYVAVDFGLQVKLYTILYTKNVSLCSRAMHM